MTIPISYHPSLDHDCVICMIHSTDYYSPFVLLGCNHTFHRKCIIKWIDKSQQYNKLLFASCPICRKKIDKSSIKLIEDSYDSEYDSYVKFARVFLCCGTC